MLLSKSKSMLFAIKSLVQIEKLPRLLSALDSVNKERITKLNRTEDQWESALATQLALYASIFTLSNHTRHGKEEIVQRFIKWQRDLKISNGKPRVLTTSSDSKEELAAQISVSHDDGFVVCASGNANGPSLGVDAISLKRGKQVCKSLHSLQAIVRRFPDSIAQQLLTSYCIEQKQDSIETTFTNTSLLFCVLWTLLEALAKAKEVSVFSTELKSMLLSGMDKENLLDWLKENSTISNTLTTCSSSTSTTTTSTTVISSLTSTETIFDKPLLAIIDSKNLYDYKDTKEYQEYLYQLFNPSYEKNIKEGQTQSETLLNQTQMGYKIETCKFIASFIGDSWISETIEYDNQIITLVESR
jgi:hypothetical protein